MARKSIASRSSWGAKYRDGVGNRAVGNLEVYMHHTVTSHLSPTASVAQEQAQVRLVELIGQQRFGAGMSYTVLIFPSGRAYWGVSPNRISYHSGAGRNTRGVAVCLVGNYEVNPITPVVERAYADVLEELGAQKIISPQRIKEAHRDFAATACPGKNAYAAKGKINNLVGKSSTPAPAPAPAPEPKPSPKPTPGKKNSHAKRAYDKGEVERIQRLLKGWRYYRGLIDDDYGSMTANAVAAYQRSQNRWGKAGLLVDSDWGPYMWRWANWVSEAQEALNEFKGGKLLVDGDYAKVTHNRVRELQHRNRRMTKPSLYVDGFLQRITINFMRSQGSKIKQRPVVGP